jgi:iron-sulfur cluster repair protein YtfE (RIC family)
MSLLIDDLKKQHSEIFAELKEANALGIITKDGQYKLLSTKADLLAHLKKEDEHLYPVLKKEAEINKHLESILDSFSSEMENISRSALGFFEKYSDGVIDSKYVEAFETLYAALSARMKNEESVLFAEYEKIEQ